MVPDEFRHLPEYGKVSGTPGSIWALLGLSGIEERKGKGGGRAPLAQSELGGGPAPLFLPSLLPFLLSYSYYLEGGNPTPGGSRTPLGRAIEGRPSPLLHSFIYGGGGTP